MKYPKEYTCMHCDKKVPYPSLAIKMWDFELSHHCSYCDELNRLLKGKVIRRDYHSKVNHEFNNIYRY